MSRPEDLPKAAPNGLKGRQEILGCGQYLRDAKQRSIVRGVNRSILFSFMGLDELVDGSGNVALCRKSAT